MGSLTGNRSVDFLTIAQGCGYFRPGQGCRALIPIRSGQVPIGHVEVPRPSRREILTPALSWRIHGEPIAPCVPGVPHFPRPGDVSVTEPDGHPVAGIRQDDVRIESTRAGWIHGGDVKLITVIRGVVLTCFPRISRPGSGVLSAERCQPMVWLQGSRTWGVFRCATLDVIVDNDHFDGDIVRQIHDGHVSAAGTQNLRGCSIVADVAPVIANVAVVNDDWIAV